MSANILIANLSAREWFDPEVLGDDSTRTCHNWSGDSIPMQAVALAHLCTGKDSFSCGNLSGTWQGDQIEFPCDHGMRADCEYGIPVPESEWNLYWLIRCEWKNIGIALLEDLVDKGDWCRRELAKRSLSELVPIELVPIELCRNLGIEVEEGASSAACERALEDALGPSYSSVIDEIKRRAANQRL